MGEPYHAIKGFTIYIGNLALQTYRNQGNYGDWMGI
jgi:hypothetical protein